ncbi:MAG TPA: TlyA family RNA methyltransferase, partial [Acholeplasma sp.]|nr:TlyA family RNA methyltransferase [Acholeplasma sp.]
LNIESRSKALDLIKKGSVYLNGQVCFKQSTEVSKEDDVEITEAIKYVSRGGLKLEDAIKKYHLDFKDKVLLDIGSSTGGFTDCALQYGAKTVYAYDVGTDQMHEKIKQNPNVILNEQTNILNVLMPIECDFVSIDVSFTSVKPILTHIKDVNAIVIILVKPQFEVGKKYIKNGIVKEKKKQIEVTDGIISYMKDLGFTYLGHKASTLMGKKGNQEYLVVMRKGVTHA